VALVECKLSVETRVEKSMTTSLVEMAAGLTEPQKRLLKKWRYHMLPSHFDGSQRRVARHLADAGILYMQPGWDNRRFSLTKVGCALAVHLSEGR